MPAMRRGSKNEPTRKVSKDGPPPLPPRPSPGHPLYRYVVSTVLLSRVPPSFTLYTQCTEPHGIAKGVYESYDPEELSFQVCIQIIEYMYINLISLHRRAMLLSYWSMLMSTGTWLGMLIMMIKRV